MERVNKLIFETEYRSSGDVSASVQKIESLQKAVQGAQGDTLKLVEAENKLKNASLEAGKAVETQTTKQTEFQRTLQNVAKTMGDVSQVNKLKQVFGESTKDIAGAEIALKKFDQAARSAKSVDELTRSVEEFLNELPDDIKADAIKKLDKEFDNLDKKIENPRRRLRELKLLIATTDDPVLLRRYNEEAGELTDRLGDNQDLINALASDTFFTDSLVESAQVAVAGFTAFQGALSLVTDDQEELARAAQKAQGALALLQGTQTLLNELKKQDNILTRAQIIGQQLYAAAVGNATGAQKAFRIALLATGIGAVIVGVGLLAANWDKLFSNTKKTNEEQERSARIFKEANAELAKETASIEVAKARLRDENITRREKSQIIKDLKTQYPGYLKDIDAEKSSYQDIETALNKVNQALFIKFQIQASEKELIRLFEDRNALERGYNNVLQQQKQEIDEVNKLQDISTEKRNEILKSVQNNSAANAAQAGIRGIDAQIKSLIDNIVQSNNELLKLGGDAKDAGDKQIEVLKGSIEFYEKELAKISDKITKSVVLNSEEFFALKPLFDAAKKQVEEARKALGEPTDAEIFTQGSLNALRKQAQDLQKIIDNLPEGKELEDRSAQLRAVEANIKLLQDIIAGPQQVQDKRNRFLDLINEEERYLLESLSIQEANELKKLEVQRRFQEIRIRQLRENGATEQEIQAAENELDLIDQRIEATQKKIAEENKKIVLQLIDGFNQVLSAALQATQQIIGIKQQENDQLIQLQQERVNRASEIADEGNAEILEAEQERLRNLEDERRRFARIQIEIATAQLVAESSLAIARAAAEGGPLAAFTIASTLIALGAGFASARAQANAIGSSSASSFRKGGVYEGGYTGAGDPNSESRALGVRPYTYHKNEHIMPSEVVNIGQNKSLLERIRIERIDMAKYFNRQSPTVVVNNDNEKVVKAIERIPSVRFDINRNGLIRIVEESTKIENKRRFIKGK